MSGDGHWLKVKLIGTHSNRSAIGAVVAVSCQGRRHVQAVMAASGYLSCGDKRLHFGLGRATVAEVEITWPNGLREELKSVADRLVTVKEGAGVVSEERMGR